MTAMTSPVQDYLAMLHERHRRVVEGNVASYIPPLACADPAWFGISLITVGGATYEVGETAQPFTIQSISKPLTFALLLEERGEDFVRAHVGVEPTGEAFNSIALDPASGAPLNPMVNAGAIAAVGLLAEDPAQASPAQRIADAYAAFAGRPLGVDEAVRASESETGHRNRAIAHLLRASDVITGEPDDIAEVYFEQCSRLVTAHDLAAIAATLANGGINPMTGVRAASEETVRSVLSVMTSCGMYDGAGEWLFTVGLPAKSGVSGGLIAVLPGRLGIGVFSPPLDEAGNSVRAVRVCEDLSRDLQLHLIQPGRRPASAIRSSLTLAQRGSKRLRGEPQAEALVALADRAGAFELQGELAFSEGEELARAVLDADLDLVVLDLRRVRRIDNAVIALIHGLRQQFAAGGGELLLTGADDLPASLSHGLTAFGELDLALEWCEDRLLEAAGVALEPMRVPLAEHEALAGLSQAALAQVSLLVQTRRFAAGDLVLERGADADEVILVMEGELSVLLSLADGTSRRVATLRAGMLLGEMSFIDRQQRTSDVRADTDVECAVLTREGLNALDDIDPRVRSQFLANVLRIVNQRAQQARAELAWLAR